MTIDSDGPIVVAGEALADLVVGDDLTVRAHLGGGPYNAARTVARLGQPAAFLGALSTDAFGRALRAGLDADGVVVDPALITEEPTTLAMVALDDAGVAEYQFYAVGTSAPALDPARRDAAVPAAMHSLHVGGLGLVYEPSASSLLSLLERTRGTALISLDPNSRPHAIDDLDEHRRVMRAAARCADIVKLSDDDAEILRPGQPPETTARELRELGPALVLLTRGSGGAVAIAGDGEFTVPAPEVAVVDTVGAGDAFSGAMLAEIRRRGLGRDDLGTADALRELVEFAVAVSAFVCTRAGADPPRRDELAGLPTPG